MYCLIMAFKFDAVTRTFSIVYNILTHFTTYTIVGGRFSRIAEISPSVSVISRGWNTVVFSVGSFGRITTRVLH